MTPPPRKSMTDEHKAALAEGRAQGRAVRAYLEASAQIGDLRLERPWYGDLCADSPLQTSTLREFLERRAARVRGRSRALPRDRLRSSWGASAE